MKNFLFALVAVFLVSFLFSCKSVPIIEETPIGIKLEKNKVFLISKVEDGKYKDSVFTGSGKKVADYFYSYIRPNASKVIIGNSDDDLAEAQKQKADYIIRAVITNWEPRNTIASGRNTKVTIYTKVINVSSGKEIVIRNLTEKQAKFSFKSLSTSVGMTNQSAEELAQQMIRELCGEFF
ncbi:MAG: DUF4823 domain-containing protein [Elusimicrobiota bacterium]|jgi:hypothetical protein|nr:DUF4823 domain-containing protein [Elusimicrobiota bacterium]